MAAVKGNLTIVTNMSSLIDNGWYAKAIAKFKQKHPNVGQIKLLRTQNFNSEAPALFESRAYGDLTLIPEHIPKDAYSNYFLPLNDMQIGEELYFSNAWEHNGKEYAYSQGVIAEGLVYNKSLFKKYNVQPPTTLKEFYHVCQIFKDNGVIPIALNIGSGWPLQQWDKAPMVVARNGAYHTQMLTDRKPFSTNKPYGTSLKIASDIYKNNWNEPYLIGDKWENSKIMFVEDELAMFFLGSWLIPQLVQKGAKANNIGFTTFPFDNSGEKVGLLNRDWGLAVSRYSKNPATAKAFLRFLLMESDFSDAAGFIPTQKTAQAKIAQMQEYQKDVVTMVQAESPSNALIRTTNMAGIDFMQGGYIRDILISSDFKQSLDYWNKKWSQAVNNL
ncbi:ABC transporter substrate-binding protein [Catenovulum sediminis]|uniref:ABC transporter substrate-binding protein n=1 Tax=Catenovulum sediminis TaxID=1740262 RepID=A0ABV1RCA3_9ALTE